MLIAQKRKINVREKHQQQLYSSNKFLTFKDNANNKVIELEKIVNRNNRDISGFNKEERNRS